GISETLVRTAVSRLVTSGQLLGERDGRRSYYRLSAAARTEFAAAAQILFGSQEAVEWNFLHLTGPEPENDMVALERLGYAKIGQRLAFGPRTPEPVPPRAVIFAAQPSAEGEGLSTSISQYWDLAGHSTSYISFINRFSPFLNIVEQTETLLPSACLTLRLLLVHQYRMIVLHDPRLPPSVLPAGWPGHQARQLFTELYRRLSPLADEHIAGSFVTGSGPLPRTTETTRQRLRAGASVSFF
ncbi:PaaX family transcriptional regulator C-terminal domain-containing protein, partial [Phyllobacterium sp. TAF24]|uniref:PaaX family transcriptional regulator C-terminal domain-containing protein n=1 Tax=Phyllobacterium sp. TAF24 TaxID=3233068 RepID=UPI003F96BF00